MRGVRSSSSNTHCVAPIARSASAVNRERVPESAGHEQRVEDERDQGAGRHAAGHDQMAADPDGEQRRELAGDQRDAAEQRPRLDLAARELEGARHLAIVAGALGRFLREGADRANAGQHLGRRGAGL